MRHLLRLISLRHLVGSPLRSALTVLGVAVGVATMTGITALNRTVMTAFRSTVDTIAGKADLTIARTGGFPEDVVEAVRAVPGVGHVSAEVSVVAPVVGHPGESLYVLGVDLLDDGHFRSYEAQGRDVGALAEDLEFLNSTDRMLVSERFAAAHGLQVGAQFSLSTPSGVKPFVVHALLTETGPIKAFGGHVALMYLHSAQEAFGLGPSFHRLEVAAAGEVDVVRERLRQTLGPTFEVERPSRRGGTVQKMVRSFQMGLNLGSGVALLVGVFLVYNTVAIGVVQRRREIGTLRALGATKRRMRWLFTLEAGLFGLFGAALGAPLGLFLARLAIGWVTSTMSQIYVQVRATDVALGPWELALGVTFGVLGSIVAALRPASVAAGVQPVEALRRDIAAGADVVQLRSAPIGLGLVLAALAWPLTYVPPPIENLPLGGYLSVFAIIMAMSLLTPLVLRGAQRLYAAPGAWLFGFSGRLAADNFARAPGRTAVPVAALAIGVAMTLCIASFVHSFQASSLRWISQSVPADLFITSSAKLGGVQNTPLESGLEVPLSKIEGVAAVDKVRIYSHDVLGLRVYIVSFIPSRYRGRTRFLEGRMPTDEEWRQDYLVISENLSRRRNLHEGDRLEMTTPTGLKTYKIRGVAVDYTGDQGVIFLARPVFEAHFQDTKVDTYELYLKDPSQLEAVRREVTGRFGQQYNLYVLSNKELRDEAVALVDGAFSITYAMEAVAVLLALLGVVNTLLAAVLDRTREIGLLRAVGASRRQVGALFVAEAALMGISGAALGTLTGAFMGSGVTKVVGVQSTGWSFDFEFPWRLAAQMLVAATVCAILAGLYPARRAARLEVVEALAYE